jgi:hypothetical protein
MAIRDSISRLQEYSRNRNLILTKELGSGTDGCVWATANRTAVKSCHREACFYREIGCYERLAEHKISRIDDCDIPALLDYDESLLVLQMDIVKPPYLLDFGKAYLNFPPNFSPEVMADTNAEQREIWGARWPEVQSIISQLADVLIYYLDTKPGNIRLRNMNDM